MKWFGFRINIGTYSNVGHLTEQMHGSEERNVCGFHCTFRSIVYYTMMV